MQEIINMPFKSIDDAQTLSDFRHAYKYNTYLNLLLGSWNT